MPNRRCISEPATPVSPIDLPTGMCELFPLPQRLDFERLTPSGCNRVARNTEPQQGVRNTSSQSGSVISHRDYLELKNYENSFDQSRRWKKTIGTFTHRIDAEFQRITYNRTTLGSDGSQSGMYLDTMSQIIPASFSQPYNTICLLELFCDTPLGAVTGAKVG